MATTRGGAPLPVVRARRSRAAKELAEMPRDAGDSESVMGELGGKAARVELYRRDGVEWAYVDTLGGDSIQKDAIKQTYGPGKYQARVFEPGVDTDAKLVDFNIAAPPQGSVQPGANDPVMRMMTALLEKLDRLSVPQPDRGMEMVARALEKMATPKDDRLMETFMTNVLPELIKSNRQAPSDNSDRVSTIELLKMLQAEREAGMQMGERVAERSSGDSMQAVAGVIRDVGAPLAAAIGERMKREDGNKARNQLPAPLVAVGIDPAHPHGEPVMTHAIPKWLEEVVPFESVVVSWAISGANVDKKAQWLLDAVDDDAFPQVGTSLALDDADALTLVYAALPGLRAHEDWSRRLLAALRVVYAAASEADEADTAT